MLDSLKRKSSDPNFDKKGHKEFFIDARGQLRIAWCKKPMVKHMNDCTPEENYEKYLSERLGGKYGSEKGHFSQQIFRKNSSLVYRNWLGELWYFRNHIKCSAEAP